MAPRTPPRVSHLLPLLLLPLLLLLLSGSLSAAFAAPSAANPTSVTIAGNLQSELGCPGDWQADCAATHLSYADDDDVWQGTFSPPAGSYEYKAALNNSWDENYGLHATPGGANIPLAAPGGPVQFFYDHKTHWITDNKNSIIATVPGSFQSELGCPGDWQPDCLRSWLQDPTGSGTYSFETTALPAGSYEGKVAINQGWDENYGQGGVPGGPNILFTVPTNNAKVVFRYNPTTHVLTILAGHGQDNNVEWDGLRHDSRDSLYRSPGGAVPAGTPVTIRLRTFHNDVTSVKLRVYDVNAGGQTLVPMQPAATNVACFQPGLEAETCDFWAATLPNTAPNNLWYRFIITDGTRTAYYADDTPALDGGLGAPTDTPVDQSFALTVYDPAFSSPAWMRRGIIYQVFPDRFNNGRQDNDPRTGDIRYDDPVLALPWGTLPEGYCRNYADAVGRCPWRFDATPPASSPDKEQPRGRDYMGGDLKGVDQKLDYLWGLGINTLYFNPIFDAGSNHSYDTQDYTRIDPYFGTQDDWENLVKHAEARGMRIVLDGVFNHMSSDSPFFDRYHHYDTVGACESLTSPWRDWFTFRDVPAGTGECVGSAGDRSASYDGWFGFDSIPVLNKSNPQVQQYFLTAPDSISKRWLSQGAGGWRLDVMGDASFPPGYWETFRSEVKTTSPDSVIIGELWQKDTTLLRFLRGDRADATMNYRLRDAVLGLLAPGPFDSKGFADSGRIIKPSEFMSRVSSIREDYPDAAYYAAMNLLDSHDTERIRWTLTPGQDTRADKEFNAANVASGAARLRLATLIQFTMPGMPTVYYGDEVAVTGDDDPDDRRTYPWGGDANPSRPQVQSHYTNLALARRMSEALMRGSFQPLLADDAADVVAYGRKTDAQAAIVVVNRGDQPRTVSVPVAGFLPDGALLSLSVSTGNVSGGPVTVTNGAVSLTLGPLSGALLQTSRMTLAPPPAPANLRVTAEGADSIDLAWDAVAGAVGYHVYRSVVSGGGYVRVNAAPITGPTYTDSDLHNAQAVFYVVRAVDATGNESAASNEVSALPHYTIGWANLQWPPTLTHTISAVNRTDNVYGQVWIDSVTSRPGATPNLRAQLGFGPTGSNPANNPAWTWVDASFNVDAGNNDEFQASLLPEAVAVYDYVYRYTTTGGHDWLYADLNGPIATGASPANPGRLTVNPSDDTTAPATPTGLRVVGASPGGVDLAWDAVSGDPSLYGYEVARGAAASGPFTTLARLTGATYTDLDVTEGGTYFYVVRAVDLSLNRSADSTPVQATAALRTVSLLFNVTVPETTDATGRSVYIAGFLDRLDGNLPQWNPGGVVLTRRDATHWTITLTGKEGTQIEYKYALGSWDYVEKDGACGEIGNRQLTLSYGSDGTQTVNDSVPNWRNVAPCGN